jgi:hypothetical protein
MGFLERVQAESKTDNINEPPPRNDQTDLDTLMKRGNDREKIDNKFRMALNSFVKLLPLITVNLAALFIIGLDNFVSGEWSWSVFQDPAFWWSYASFQTANWIVAITFLTGAIRMFQSNYKKYLENLDFIQGMVDYDHEKKAFITAQCEIETLRRKKEILMLIVGKKLYDLKAKHEIKDVVTFLEDGMVDGASRREKRLYRKIHALYAMTTLEWQQEYLQGFNGSRWLGIKLRFPEVTRALLVSGFKPSKRAGAYNDYQSRVFGTSANLIAPNTVVSMAVGLLLLSFQFETKQADAGTWLNFIVKVLLIIWNTYMTRSFSGVIFMRTHMRVSEERRTDLVLFKRRAETGNQDTQDILAIINKPDIEMQT